MKMLNPLLKKLKRIAFIILILGIGVGAFTIGYRLTSFSEPSETAVLNQEKGYEKITFDLKESILEEAQEKRELIVLEVELKEKISLDESWGELAIFKKIKNIDYYGRGSFAVNLSMLQEEAITIDSSLKTITLEFSKPLIKECYLQEEKTLYESTENGLLRFGEITLTAEDSSLLRQKVLERMKKKLYEEELLLQATASAESSLEEIFRGVAQGITGEAYQIEIILQ
ncbi:MAG: DUF4230 domain-containing protein [Clostridiaceae bacterium]